MRYSDGIRSRVGERWLILAVLFLARTAMAFQFQAFAALSSFVIAELGIDYTQLGLLIGLYLLPGIVIAYPGGLLGGVFGDKRIALIGLLLMAAGGLLTATGDYPTVVAGRLISGAGAVLLNVLLTKMTTDWFAGREIGTALAVLVTSWPFGIGLALVTLPWLAARVSFAAALRARQRLPLWCWCWLRRSTAFLRSQSRRRRRALKRAGTCRCASSAWCRWPAACGCCSMSASSWLSASVRRC